MFNVACESCQAPFEVDERRLPPSGAKMRCPKCGASFLVRPPGASSAGAVAAPPVPPKPSISPPRAPAPSLSPPRAPAPKAPLRSTALGMGMPSRPAPAPPSPMPKSMQPTAASADLLDLDLPPPARALGGELDLPALDDIFPDPRTAGDDLPPPPAMGVSKLSSPMSPPAAPSRFQKLAPSISEPPTELSLDLPAPKMDLDLPAPKMDLDLPAPKLDLDLPMPKPSTSTDLPALKASADLPTPRMSFGELDLPAVASSVDLPAPKEQVDLPRPASKATDLGFGDLELPTPKLRPDQRKTNSELPVPNLEGFDLPTPGNAAGLGADFPLPEPPGDEFPLPQMDAGPPASFGEIELPGGLDDMELGIPEASGGQRPSQLTVDLPARTSATLGAARRIEAGRVAEQHAAEGAERGKLRRNAVLGAAAVVGLLAGGAALSTTSFGPFGRYAIEQMLPAAGTESGAQAIIEQAEGQASLDTYADVRASLATLSNGRRSMGLQRALLARSVVHEGLYLQRFGADASSGPRIIQILARIDERGGQAPGITLARAADALRSNRLDEAVRLATEARGQAPQDGYVDLVLGEALLAKRQYAPAAAAFRVAITHHAAARGQWGLARALDALARSSTDAAAVAAAETEARATIDALLSASTGHVGARVQKARYLIAGGSLSEAQVLLEEATGRRNVGEETLSSSKLERAAALGVLGELYARTRRLREAHEVYEAALALDSGRLDLLLGDGRALLGMQRYQDALSRFEAINSSTTGTDVPLEGRTIGQHSKVGAAAALAKLERAQEARALLQALSQELPSDVEVLLAAGHVAEVLRDASAAEQHFRDVIRTVPANFEGYLALAHLFASTGRENEAAVVLEECTRNVPESADMLRALGDAELERNHLDIARGKYVRALELDANHTGARFGLGVTERRARNFIAAHEAFEYLAERESNYPGLDLERGMVFEARGLATEAVRAYTSALSAKPDDLDLQLRLGAAQVAAGQLDAAEAVLTHVRDLRPSSAEVEHFFGRLSLARGDLEEARTHLERAVSLDGSRAEFHLYAAWVARDQNSFGKALEEIEAALERDPSLGDAYWIRGEVRLRSGAVRDALTDFERAIELKPGRIEAQAGRAEALEQLRKRPEAIAAYEIAVQGLPERGDWWYRLGQLRWDERNRAGALDALARAEHLGDVLSPAPAWLADTHRLLGDALRLGGDRAGAITHYEKYLATSQRAAIDRDDVTRNLEELRRGN